MSITAVIRQRLARQQISATAFSNPEGLVRWMGCMQAQDFGQAKWAIGTRLSGVTEAAIEKDFNEGKILRTHILRPTWHFVSPSDIGWILALTAPAIRAFNKNLHKKLDIDDKTLRRSKTIIGNALAGGVQLTRTQLLPLFKKARINTDDIRINFLMMNAELDGTICSGGRQGKQFTYALLSERAPGSLSLDPEAALAELAHRYFISRGPATLRDFAWWSGLPVASARKGIDLNKRNLAHIIIEGDAYWFSPESRSSADFSVDSSANSPSDSSADSPSRFPADDKASAKTPARKAGAAYLLPAFDEYMVAYKDRSGILEEADYKKTGNGIFKPVIILNGRIAGTWKPLFHKSSVSVEMQSFGELSKRAYSQIRSAAERYALYADRSFTGLQSA